MFRRLVAGFLIAIFVMISVPLVFIWAFYGTYADRDFYSERLVSATYDLLLSELPHRVNLEEFEGLQREDIADLIEKIISKEDLQTFVDGVIEDLENATVDEQGKIQVRIPLDILAEKSEVISEGLADLMYEKFPECEGSMPDSDSFDCIPPNLAQLDFQREVKNRLNRDVFADLPSEFAFDVDAPSGISGNLFDFVGSVARLVFLCGFALMAFILLLIGLIIWKPWIKVLKWLSSAVITSSVLVSVYPVLFLLVPRILNDQLIEEFGDEQRIRAVQGFYNVVVGAFAKNILLYSIPSFVLGLGVFIFVIVRYHKVESHDTS